MLVIFLCVSNACHLYVCLCVFRCTQWAPDRDAEKDCADVGEEKREKHTLVGDEDEEVVYTYIYMYVGMYMCKYACVHIYICVYVYIYMNTYIYIYTYKYIYIYTYIYTYIYVHIYIYLYVYKIGRASCRERV